MILDPESLIVLNTNIAFQQMMNIPAAQSKGRSVLQWVLPAQREDLRKALQMAKRDQMPAAVRFSFQLGCEQEIQLELQAWVLKLNSQTKVLEVIAVPVHVIGVGGRSSMSLLASHDVRTHPLARVPSR